MIGKDEILQSLRNENEIIKNLFTLIPQGGLDYRPTPEQRSLRELLQYLSIMISAPLNLMESGEFQRFGEWQEQAAKLDIQSFPAAMDRQMQEVRDYLAGLSDSEFAERPAYLPTGATKTCEWVFLNIFLPWLAGYKMQLFLYIKQAGNSEIGTRECWLPPQGW